MLRRQPRDDAPGPRRPGERHELHARVGDERLADIGAAGQHGEQAGGQARLLEDARQGHAPHTAVRGSGFKMTALPSASAGATARIERMSGRVERRDHADDADGHAPRERQVRRVRSQDLAVGQRGQAGRAVAGGDRELRLPRSERRDGARLTDDPAVDLLGVALPQIARLAQHRRALFVRLGRPGPLRLGRARRGLAHVGGVGHPDAPELTARGGLDDGSLAAAARAPTIEEQLSGPGLRLEKVHGPPFLAGRSERCPWNARSQGVARSFGGAGRHFLRV